MASSNRVTFKLSGRVFLLFAALALLAALVGGIASANHLGGLLGGWKFDEGSGATAADSSGHANTGTLVNGPIWSADTPLPGGSSLSFDGSNDYVNVGSGANIANSSFTIAGWLKRSPGGGNDFALGQGVPGVNTAMHFGFLGNSRGFTCAFYANDLDTGIQDADNTWHHWACTYDLSTQSRRIYRDGLLVASQLSGVSAYQGTGTMVIGANYYGAPTNFFKGLIDDMQVYNRALAQLEVASLTVPPPAAPANCTAILLGGGSVGNGIYTIDPAQNGSTISVYCDMTTNGGGWTLAGYGANSNLAGKLNVANGAYNPTNRTGSANINALPIAKNSSQVALSWSNGTANGDLSTYQEAVGYDIPNPSTQTLDPVGGGYQCASTFWTAVTVNKLVGTPNLPSQMYTRTASLGAVYGLAYGLARSNGNPQCDWTIDGQAFRAVYLGINSPPYATGVVYEPGGSSNSIIPATMAI